MALVTQDEVPTDGLSPTAGSVTSQRVQAQVTEHAKRNLLGVMDYKEKQADHLRAAIERKKKHLSDEKGAVEALYDKKQADEAEIQSLREEKLLWRVFKQMDYDKKNALSLENLKRAMGGDEEAEAGLEENLFNRLPTTFTITFRARDFSSEALSAFITETTGLSDKALEIDILENTVHGIAKVALRVAWHAHPADIAEDPSLTDEQNEQRREEVEAYYQSIGGREPEAGRQKEEEVLAAIKDSLPGALGWTVTRSVAETRVTFADFLDHFWNENEVPKSLQALRAQAKVVEEETILPEEALDRVTELEHAIKHQQKLKNQVIRDTQFVDKDIASVDKQIDKVSKELLQIQHVTGYDSAHAKKDHVDWHLQQEEITQLHALVKKLEEEQRMGQHILKKKTQLLEVLSEEVAQKDEVQEQLFKAKNDLKVLNKEIEALIEGQHKLMHEHNKSDRAIAVLDQQRDVVAVHSLQADKQYLQKEIANHVSAKAETSRAIRAQSVRISTLENRLSVVTEALKDLKSDHKIQKRLREALTTTEDDGADPTDIAAILPQNELVDVELYELLARDLEAITTSIKLKDIILLEKEATIEATELKLQSLAQEKEEDEEYYHYITHKDAKELSSLKSEHRARQGSQRREREELKKSVNAARQKAAQMLKPQA